MYTIRLFVSVVALANPLCAAVALGSADDRPATFAVPMEVRPVLAAYCRGRFSQLPNYGKPGHKTLGNWYTTLLNAYGNPIKHFGDPDRGLARFGFNQTGAIKQFLG